MGEGQTGQEKEVSLQSFPRAASHVTSANPWDRLTVVAAAMSSKDVSMENHKIKPLVPQLRSTGARPAFVVSQHLSLPPSLL